MCVCKMTDLPGRSVAFTSMCTTKLEHFGEIKTHGKSNFENGFKNGFSSFRKNNYLLTKLELGVFRETTVDFERIQELLFIGSFLSSFEHMPL